MPRDRPSRRHCTASSITASPPSGPKRLELVRAAAVVGGRFTHERLAAASGRDRDDIIGSLREAIDARILVTVDDAGDPTYTFRHALLREAAYDDLLPAERVRIHHRLADHLASLLEGGREPDPSLLGDLALHAYHAHDQARALTSAVRAMDPLIAAAAFREALGHAERALELWPRVATAEALTGLDHAGLLARAAQVAANAGDPRRAVAFDQAALLEIDPGEQGERRVSLLTDLWVAAWEADAMDVAVEAARTAVELIESWPASELTARVLVQAGSDRWTAGRFHEAVELYEASMAIAREIGDERAWVVAASPLAHSLASLGGPGGRHAWWTRPEASRCPSTTGSGRSGSRSTRP